MSLITACAQKAPETKLKVSIGSISGSSNFPNGLIITGKNNLGFQFVRKVGLNDDLSIELPNGIWSFATIGWANPGNSNAFEGNSFCDTMNNVALSGNEINLNMTVTTTKCSRPLFGGHTDAAGFFPLKINSCLGMINYLIDKGPQAAPAGMACDGQNGNPFSANVKSFKVVIPEVNRFPNGNFKVTGQMNSECLTATNGAVDTNIKLPFSSQQFALPVTIHAYSNTGCSGAPKLYRYKDGFNNLAVNNLAGATADPTNSKIGLYLHENSCVGSQLTNEPFAAGSSTTKTYLICTAAQFVNIAKGAGSCPQETSGLPNMYCEADATYVLGKDIDFDDISTPQNSNAYVISPFTGVLEGQGKVIKNAERPLFGTISNPASGNLQKVFITNFTIEDSDIVVPSASGNIGILAKNVSNTTAGTSADIEIENIKIADSSSLVVNNNSGSGAYGGLIGKISHTSTSKFTIIKRCEQLADIETNSYINWDNALPSTLPSKTGGLVGEAIGPTDASEPGKLMFEQNAVGALLSNPKSALKQITIKGNSNIGGLIGSMKDTQVRAYNYVYAKIEGYDDNWSIAGFGGIAGVADATNNGASKIFSSYANIEFDPQVTAARVGGIIGDAKADNPISIEGTISNLKIDSTAIGVSYVGGVVGYSVGSTSKFIIRNAKAETSTTSDGAHYGGIIGKFDYTSLDSTAKPTIAYSYAYGKLGTEVNSTSGSNSMRGGIAGYAKNLETKMIIVDNMDIEGYQNLGGGFGKSENSKLDEVYVNSNITIKGSASSIYAGGAIGKEESATLPSTPSRLITNSKFISHIEDSDPNTNLACSTVKCGTLVGSLSSILITNEITDNISENNIAIGTINTTPANTTPVANNDTCGDNCSYNTTSPPGATIDLVKGSAQLLTSDSSCSGLLGQFTDKTSTIPCTPLFQLRWEESGWDDTNNDYLAGNMLEPFRVSDVDEWNAIGDDLFLMQKTFELTNNLDFEDQTFTSIGGNNPFKGRFIANGKKLLNIDVTFATGPVNSGGNCGGATSCGVFNAIEGAHIGEPHDPFIVENSTFNFGNAFIGGIIGQSTNSFISIIARNVTHTGGTGATQHIGGLLGLSYNGTDEIINSSFVGDIDVNSDFAGGLVGKVGDSVDIQQSFAKLGKLIATDTGGFIGEVDANNSSSISNSYLTFNLESASDIDDNNFGGIASTSNKNINITNSYLDFTNLNSDNVDIDNFKPFVYTYSVGIISKIYGANAILGTTTSTPVVNTDYSLNTNTSLGPNGTYYTPANHQVLGGLFNVGQEDSPWVMGSDGKVHLSWEFAP